MHHALIAALVSLTLLVMPAWADKSGTAGEKREPASTEEGIALKMTPTFYHNSSATNAWDINLRGNKGDHTAWVGYYRQENEFQQLRGGYEHAIALPFVKLTPSLQFASRGFLGGSLNAEIGERYFALLGWGRTNLKAYYNLNFDPNDAITVGVGTHALPNTTLSLYQIRDDRLHTRQHITHLVARIKAGNKARWTFDVFRKSGRPDADPASDTLRGTGGSITFDYAAYFVRVANDPYVNFTNNHMVRVAAGMRF